MTAKEFLDAGDLSAAISEASEQVRRNPIDRQARIFLFELLCFAGNLDRAEKQLAVIAAEGPDADAAVQRYRNALKHEQYRRLVFSEGRLPGLPKRVPAYTEAYLDAIRYVREGDPDTAVHMLQQVQSAVPDLQGEINGERFDSMHDADDLLAPFLEIITPDNYCWVPWEAVRSLTIQEPKYLRDLIWIPATLELDIGPLGEVFLPVLYNGSYLHPDNAVKLGRCTEWRGDVEGLALAQGQKLLTTGDRDWPILEIRSIEFEERQVYYGGTGVSA